MNTGHSSLNALWADLIIEELVRQQVDYFCLSPGSRSTPLTAAVATNPSAKSIMHFDERGAAFHALGYARATGKPAVLVCTSGTAAANYLPAVIEASVDNVPMILLTADRPPELREAGANQTIDQVGLYGDYPRWFVDLPCPTEDVCPEYVLTTIDQAVYRSRRVPAGPVHINCMFREPLAPVGSEQDFEDYLHPIERWRSHSAPYTRTHDATTVCEPARLEDAARLVNGVEKGVILVGRVRSERDRTSIIKVADALGWPVFPDIGSGLRLGPDVPQRIAYYDQMLGGELFGEQNQPTAVLQFGSTLVSKRLLQWLQAAHPATYIQVADQPERIDPAHIVTHRYESDIAMFCDFLLPFLTPSRGTAWLEMWQGASVAVGEVIEQALGKEKAITEPSVSRVISRLIAPDSVLFLASSMPIRDMDMFGVADGPAVTIGCNRGASGIDGTVATFAGFAAGAGKRGTLLIGDLALLHDLNSLALIKESKHPLTIVVLNNGGGGIFSFLPIAQRDDLFEQYFGTPHEFGFEPAAKMFGLRYVNWSTLYEFETAFRQAQKSSGSTLIEVRTDRTANQQLHQHLLQRVAETL